MRWIISNDHGGVNLKTELKNYLLEHGHDVQDVGSDAPKDDDIFAEYADAGIAALKQNKADYAVLICGSGIGISMRANRHKGIRAALVHNTFTAHACKAHNNANVLCFGERVIDTQTAIDCLKVFIETEYEGGRHVKRVAAIDNKTE